MNENDTIHVELDDRDIAILNRLTNVGMAIGPKTARQATRLAKKVQTSILDQDPEARRAAADTLDDIASYDPELAESIRADLGMDEPDPITEAEVEAFDVDEFHDEVLGP